MSNKENQFFILLKYYALFALSVFVWVQITSHNWCGAECGLWVKLYEDLLYVLILFNGLLTGSVIYFAGNKAIKFIKTKLNG